jgi:opacity protein-like surface antigen
METFLSFWMDTLKFRGEDEQVCNRILGCERGRPMSKFVILCGAILCLSMSAAAQDSTVAFDASSTAAEPAAPASFSPPDRDAWQVGAGFQYQHFGVFGLSFHNLGFNSEVTRYFNNWVGIEGAAEMGWGHTNTTPTVPRSLVAKSLFVGGGPHIVVSNNSRVEPWGHVLVGLEHFRFTQSGSPSLGSNSAFGFQAGGGIDFKIGGHVNWRVQADYVGSRFQSTIQSNYSFGSGLVFGF